MSSIGDILKKIWLKVDLLAPLACFGVLFLILHTTSPDDITPVALLIIFLLLYGVVFGLTNLLFVFFFKLYGTILADLPKKPSVFITKRKRLVALISCAPIFLLAVQSVKPVSLLDIVLVVAIVIVGSTVIIKG